MAMISVGASPYRVEINQCIAEIARIIFGFSPHEQDVRITKDHPGVAHVAIAGSWLGPVFNIPDPGMPGHVIRRRSSENRHVIVIDYGILDTIVSFPHPVITATEAPPTLR